jgi:catechol 2,3-dioxygenase-like lactoylglutathione lyase family enzyme
MVLNHVDLQVTDVQRAAAFFVRHFGFSLTSNPSSPAIAILSGEGGVTLVLQRRKDDRPWPEGFHIGFIVDDVARVHEFHAAASAEGIRVSPVQTNGRGTMTYCSFDDVLIEVSVRKPHEQRG